MTRQMVKFEELESIRLRLSLSVIDFVTLIRIDKATYHKYRQRDKLPEVVVENAQLRTKGMKASGRTMPRLYRGTNVKQYGFAKMAVGERKLVEIDDIHTTRNAVYNYNGRHPERKLLLHRGELPGLCEVERVK